MLLMGIGIGPAMSGFTVVVQNVVPVRELGVATSTMTFLRQVGGSVGLAISGTIFSEAFATQLPKSLAAQNISPQALGRLAGLLRHAGVNNITGVNLGAALAQLAPPFLRPWVPAVVNGIHEAFSLAVGQVFWLTFWSSLVALGATLLVREIPLRGPSTVPAEAAATVTGSEVPVGRPKESEVVPAP
jgi:hypothetical protein